MDKTLEKTNNSLSEQILIQHNEINKLMNNMIESTKNAKIVQSWIDNYLKTLGKDSLEDVTKEELGDEIFKTEKMFDYQDDGHTISNMHKYISILAYEKRYKK